MSNYYTLLTDIGASAMVVAAVNNTPINLSEVALGDGNGSVPLPVPSSRLVNEVYRAGINSITQDPVNSAWYVIELVVPPEVGGFHVREIAVYDSSGETIYIGNHPPEYKPILAEGSTRETLYKIIVETSNAAEINLLVDPSIVMATHQYVANAIADHEAKADPHPQYITESELQLRLNNRKARRFYFANI
ncbi:Phage tail-collar fibre protein [Nitrosomonas marina]|uniref:Phage tail-collar fibre protein n=1 Tax=Nitrosomonas marina TaxID=917 RepID=A0A1I0EJH2_9PROT|nr:phage tail protein [Nitrosomonas marina]SET44637.1 Phage tail-collar fibre protein [Nitrosomonas marina]